MPESLAKARAIDGWCKAYGTLPWPGSVLEQPAIHWLRWQNLIALGGQESTPQHDALADIPMVAL